MMSTELIKRFPKDPAKPILYVVYNDEMIESAKFLIEHIHGASYLKHVTITAFDARPKDGHYELYIDPTVYTYKHSWNN